MTHKYSLYSLTGTTQARLIRFDGLQYTASSQAYSVIVTGYSPKTPTQTVQSSTSPFYDGDPISNVTRRNVTETVEIYIEADSSIQLVNGIRGLELVLQKAELAQRFNSGERLYWSVQVDGDVAWRSEILAARLELNNDAMALWANSSTVATLHLTRKPFFEYASVIEARISSKYSTTAGQGGKVVHDHTDSTYGNYIDVSNNQIAGSLPTPAIIVLKNSSSLARSYRNIYIGSSSRYDGPSTTHSWQGEEAASDWTITESAAFSSGQAVETSFSGTTTLYWSISTAQATVMAGRRFRVLAKFAEYSTYASIYGKFKTTDEDGAIIIAEASEVKLPVPQKQLIDFGLVQVIPSRTLPYQFDSLAFPYGDWGTLRFALELRSDVGVLAEVDFVQLLPAEEFRHLVVRGDTIAIGDAIIDDGEENTAYVRQDSILNTPATPIVSARGNPIMLYPGTTNLQRIYILHDEGASSLIGSQFTVQVYYRPRKLTV